MFSTMPAIVMIVAGALGSGTRSLAGAAFNEAVRRAVMPAASRALTMSDLPAAARRPAEPIDEVKPEAASEPQGATVPPAADKTTDKGAAGEEAEWRARMTAAREALDRDGLLAEAMQTRANSLTNDVASRDDPAQRQQLIAQRNRALQELDRLKDQVDKDTKAISDIEEEARRKGVPPGWIRAATATRSPASRL